jgi:hypothetical protein
VVDPTLHRAAAPVPPRPSAHAHEVKGRDHKYFQIDLSWNKRIDINIDSAA